MSRTVICRIPTSGQPVRMALIDPSDLQTGFRPARAFSDSGWRGDARDLAAVRHLAQKVGKGHGITQGRPSVVLMVSGINAELRVRHVCLWNQGIADSRRTWVNFPGSWQVARHVLAGCQRGHRRWRRPRASCVAIPSAARTRSMRFSGNGAGAGTSVRNQPHDGSHATTQATWVQAKG